MSAEWAARPSQPIQHPPIERHSLPQWTSHWCMSPKKNPFCAKNLKTNYNVTPYGGHGTERVNLHWSLMFHWEGLITDEMWCPRCPFEGGGSTDGLAGHLSEGTIDHKQETGIVQYFFTFMLCLCKNIHSNTTTECRLRATIQILAAVKVVAGFMVKVMKKILGIYSHKTCTCCVFIHSRLLTRC
jgi:hypothetical protein